MVYLVLFCSVPMDLLDSMKHRRGTKHIASNTWNTGHGAHINRRISTTRGYRLLKMVGTKKGDYKCKPTLRIVSAGVCSTMSCRVQSAECRAVAIMSGRAIDESLDRAAVQVPPGAGALMRKAARGRSRRRGWMLNPRQPRWPVSTRFAL